MMRNRSGLGNANGNQQPKPQVNECAPEVPIVPDLITMARVQAMTHMMLDC